MEKNELPSSDDSDADFVPKEEDYNSGSGSEGLSSESLESENESKSVKRKKNITKSSKKIKCSKNKSETEKETNVEEKSKIDIDALYADFKRDVDSKIAKETDSKKQINNTINTTNSNINASSEENQSRENLKHKGTPSFLNKNRSGGLQSIISQIGKKDKISTLQKSQLDWNKFKKSEGIEEEIKRHNRGKDGYLEKQDFLQRTDLRQFEIEKDLRSARRKF